MDTASRVCLVALALWLPPATAQEPARSGTDTEKQQRQEVRKEVGEAVDAIHSYSIERRKDAVAQARRAMDEADRRTDQLQARIIEGWDRMDASARQRSQRAMTDLRRRRGTLAEWAGGMQHGSKEAWEEVKAGFVRSYHEFLDALERARAESSKDAGQHRSPDDKTSSQKQREQER